MNGGDKRRCDDDGELRESSRPPTAPAASSSQTEGPRSSSSAIDARAPTEKLRDVSGGENDRDAIDKPSIGPLSVSMSSPLAALAITTYDASSYGNERSTVKPPPHPPAANDGDNENDNDDGYTSVQVAVRIRPTLEDSDEDCIRCLPPPPHYVDPASSRRAGGAAAANSQGPPPPPQTLQIGGSKGPVFSFDRVFGRSSRQDELYRTVVDPLVSNCLEGYNATVLAYGQTGSGKTYTVIGESSVHDHSTAGIIPRALADMFRRLDLKQRDQQQQQQQQRPSSDGSAEDPSQDDVIDDDSDPPSYVVKLQFLELYGEEIRDLLVNHSLGGASGGGGGVSAVGSGVSGSGGISNGMGRHKLTIREVNGEPEVVGATQQVVQTPQEALLALTHGMVRRVTGATAMNSSSSRSHAILTVFLEQQSATQLQVSKFQFVDLAGSERQKRTGAQGKRLKEGIDINKGLLVLGNVISALASNSPFVPYRDSKLTRMLQGSLGGNHKTLMIACVSPSPANLDESLNCLRYANRAKNITNQARINTSSLNLERVVDQLQSQLGVVARALLRAADKGYPLHASESDKEGEGEAEANPVLSREGLQALARGQLLMDISSGGGLGGRRGSPSNGAFRIVGNGGAATPQNGSRGANLLSPSSSVRGLRPDADRELSVLRAALQESQKHQDAAEQELYHVKAQKQVLEMHLATSDASSAISCEGVDPKESPRPSFDAAFVHKVEQYEQEIGQLKMALQKAEKQCRSALVDWEADEREQQAAMQRYYAGVEADRRKLESLRTEIGFDSEGEPLPIDTPRTRMEKEDNKEEAQLQDLTRKYLLDDDEEEGEAQPFAGGEPDASATEPESDPRHIRADLVELSRNIAAKEDLIGQLRLSQEKYATMRDFYEGRLKQMETTLQEKEAERENLLKELQRSKGPQSEGSRKVLEEKLKEKDSELVSLRKHQKELKELTRVSSRNNAEIQRLQEDVVAMKRRKVEMQNQLGHERKHHLSEKREMEKAMMQKDREANKWQKLSTQHEIQAQKSNQIAKARLEEIGHLRSKYKDAEKKIRVLSLKRGVMEKAGLNQVMVGRRNRATVSTDDVKQSQMDVDALRDLFDQRVAEVVRKEAIADKLANEWEEHFELSSKLQELLKDEDRSDDELQSLRIQIQFKEDRIRQLAQRMGKRVGHTGDEEPMSPGSKSLSFLFDSAFERICSGSPEDRHSVAATVLFGMVVRERRRVASLARTASSLDERAQALDKTASENEEALRAYMSEQQRELAALKQSQQEQILSLMDLVKQPAQNGGAPGAGSDSADRKLLVLANERISLLERQLDELQINSEASDSYRDRVNELNENIARSARENDEIQQRLSEMRTLLRQIRELVVSNGGQPVGDFNHMNTAILEIINGALHPRQSGTKNRPRATSSRDSKSSFAQSAVSPRMKKHVELMHTSDSEEDGDTPEWAAEIMNDLACIAQGKVPPSLQGSSYLLDDLAGEPLKRPSDEVSMSTGSSIAPVKSSPQRIQTPASHRLAMSKEIAARLDQIVVPTVDSSDSFLGNAITPPSMPQPSSQPTTSQKSVFERLMTPSHFTGTQKGRFQSQQPKKFRGSSDPAAKLLDALLQSDSESSRLKKEKANSKSRDEYAQQDVFERLTKTTTQAYAVKQMNPIRPEAASHNDGESDDVLDELLRSDSEAPRWDDGSRSSRSKVDYSQQDVFERLNKTTTHAFAVKQNDPVKVVPAMPKADIPANEGVKDLGMDDSQRGESGRQHILSKTKAEYIQQDVFERLQRTTTQAYAVKLLDTQGLDDKEQVSPPTSNRSSKAPTDDASPTFTTSSRGSQKDATASAAAVRSIATDKTASTGYTSQDVFERLQKTTTEAYAKKTSSRHDEI